MALAGSAQPQLSERVAVPPTDLTTSQAREVLETEEMRPDEEMFETQGQRSPSVASGGTETDNVVDDTDDNRIALGVAAHTLRPTLGRYTDISLCMALLPQILNMLLPKSPHKGLQPQIPNPHQILYYKLCFFYIYFVHLSVSP